MKDRYLKHARRFGTEGILAAAADAGLPLADLIEIQTELDQIDSASARFPKKQRLTVEERVKRFLGIEENQ